MSLHRLVVYGGGVSAWVAAAALANAYSADSVEIVLINPGLENDEPSIADSGFASLRRFHANMRISERELMNQTSATFKVGVRYRDWVKLGQNFVHGLGNFGSMLDGIDFHQYAILLHQCGDKTPFDSYSLAAASANLGKFSFLGKDLMEKGFTLDYSLHVDLPLYTSSMQTFAAKKQLHVIHGRLEHINLDESNNIKSIVLNSGAVVEGDFFVDCSGSNSALMSKLKGDKFIEWNKELPINRQASVVVDAALKSRLCTGLSAQQHGWITSIPLRGKTLYTLTYNSEFTSDEQAITALKSAVGSTGSESIHLYNCAPGRRQSFWLGNCIAIGAASGSFADLTFSYLHHVQNGILRFINLYSTAGQNHFAAQQYNQITSAEYSRILDYQQLNLLLCTSHTSGFWKAMSNIPCSDELKHKMDLFKSRGKLAFNEYETWMPGSWISLLLGNGYWPEKHDVLLNGCKLELVVNKLQQMKMAYSNLATQLADENEFLSRYTTLS